jgi:transposase
MLGLVRGHLSSRQKKGGKVAWRLHRKTFSSDERDPSCRWDVRQCAAWLGLVPHQHSTGSKTRLLGITKRGNSYVRRLLVHGARAMLAAAERFHKTDALSCWARAVSQRRGKNRAVVAVAN